MKDTLTASVPIVVAIITATFSLLGSLLAVFKDEIKEYIKTRKKPVLRAEDESFVSIGLNEVAFDKDLRVRKRPFDTNISVSKSRSQDEIRFEIPSRKPHWFPIIFMTGWLLAWTAGIVAAGSAFFGMLFGGVRSGTAEDDLFGIVFMGGWLIAALAGEVAVTRQLKKSIFSSSAIVELNFGVAGILTVKRQHGRIRHATQYLIANIDGFEKFGPTPVSIGFGQDNTSGVFFRYGINRVTLDGITDNEAEWLAQELNRALDVSGKSEGREAGKRINEA